MEHIKEITKNLKARVSDPLIFSFTLAWLISNWKITIYLFFASQFQHNNPIENIEAYLSSVSSCRLTWLPLLIAFFYTLAYPYLSLIFLYVRKPGLLLRKKIEDIDVAIRKYDEIKIENDRLETEIKRITEEKKTVSEKFNTLSRDKEEFRKKAYSDLHKLSSLIYEYRKVLFSILRVEDTSIELGELRYFIQKSDDLLHKIANRFTLKLNENYDSLHLKYKDVKLDTTVDPSIGKSGKELDQMFQSKETDLFTEFQL